MVKSKLLSALDAHKGRNYKLEKQKALQKQAVKRKQSKLVSQHSANDVDKKTLILQDLKADDDEWESEESGGDAPVGVNVSRLDDIDDSESGSDSASEPSSGVNDEDIANPRVDDELNENSLDEFSDDGIPLSDIDSLSSNEKGDIVPHQRLTINNTTALLKAHRSIALPLKTLPFSAHQTITSAEQTSIPDVNDDLNRELAFYKQCLDATVEARALLKKEDVPFSRPIDYFAEMVKSDEHMGKIKSKMTEEAVNKKAAAEARKQRDLKKFGKQVQVAKLQERDKAKRETLDKINLLKRKRRDAGTGNTNEEDLFDVALEDATKGERSRRSGKDGAEKPREGKRQKKDAKFGFGGKKRFAKSGDALSTGDLRGFSAKKMKGQKKGTPRPGKSKRNKQS